MVVHLRLLISLPALHCTNPICSRAAKIWTEAQSSQGLNRGIREIRGKEMESVFPAGFRVFRVFRGYSFRFGCGWSRCVLCVLIDDEFLRPFSVNLCLCACQPEL